MKATPSKALFLDRDGVINIDHGYVHRVNQVEFCDGIFALARTACERGYAIVIVTNQAGIGRGFYSEQDFQRLSAWMRGVFEREGAAITRMYHCPDHPEFGVGAHKRDSPLRKPAPGMLLQAAADLGLALAESFMVGDSETDIEAGLRAGVRLTFLLAATAEEAAAARRHTRADVVVHALGMIEPYL